MYQHIIFYQVLKRDMYVHGTGPVLHIRKQIGKYLCCFTLYVEFWVVRMFLLNVLIRLISNLTMQQIIRVQSHQMLYGVLSSNIGNFQLCIQPVFGRYSHVLLLCLCTFISICLHEFTCTNIFICYPFLLSCA